MGRDITLALAREGADIAWAPDARRAWSRWRRRSRRSGAGRSGSQTDITSTDDCERLARTAHDELGRVDILVNNAFSDGTFTLFEEGELDGWRSTMDVNLFGTMQMTQAALPFLRGAGRQPRHHGQQPGRAGRAGAVRAYAASKGALAVATQGLARELGRYGVRVNGIHPSYIWGKSVEWYVNDMAEKRGVDFQVVYDELADQTCLKYLPAFERDRRRRGVLRLAAGQGGHRPEPERELRRVPLLRSSCDGEAGVLPQAQGGLTLDEFYEHWLGPPRAR